MKKDKNIEEILSEFDNLQHGSIGDFDGDYIDFETVKQFIENALQTIRESTLKQVEDKLLKKENIFDIFDWDDDTDPNIVYRETKERDIDLIKQLIKNS